MRKWLAGHLKKRGLALLLDIFVAIPISLIVAAVVLFFSNVLFGREWGYLSIVKWGYLCILFISLIIEIGKLIRLVWSFFIMEAEYKASFEEILEATELGLFDPKGNTGFSKMTPEEFRAWLEERRKIRNLAKKMADVFINELRNSPDKE